MTDGTYVLHFKDFDNPITVGAGETIEIDISTLVG
jgi:major membrane immunogen (membrane-anchored lipoprotein)